MVFFVQPRAALCEAHPRWFGCRRMLRSPSCERLSQLNQVDVHLDGGGAIRLSAHEVDLARSHDSKTLTEVVPRQRLLDVEGPSRDIGLRVFYNRLSHGVRVFLRFKLNLAHGELVVGEDR